MVFAALGPRQSAVEILVPPTPTSLHGQPATRGAMVEPPYKSRLRGEKWVPGAGKVRFLTIAEKNRHKRAQHRQKVSGGFWATHM